MLSRSWSAEILMRNNFSADIASIKNLVLMVVWWWLLYFAVKGVQFVI